MSACVDCGTAVEPTNWESYRVIETDTGRYFQGPKRVWLLESPGVKAYMVGRELHCAGCFEK